MGYLYEMHCHSREGSACSDFPVVDMVRFYKEKGYAGMVITDHFTGNCALPDGLSWQERVRQFYGIYERTAEEGRKIGIDVFFGLEYSITREGQGLRSSTGTDFLFLGLTLDWLLENGQAFVPRPNELLDAVHAAGGYIVHAHPFLEAAWVEYIRLLPRKVDAVEILNGCLDDKTNGMARQYAENYGLAITCGSDVHHATDAKVLTCVETQQPCHTVQALIAEIAARRVTVRRYGEKE